MLDNNISKIIRQRKSIFPSHFNNKKISKKIILELLINANTAPSHKLTQPWFFKIFSENSKFKLAEEIHKTQCNNNEEALQRLKQKFDNSSHIICICMRRHEKKIIPEWEEIAATAMAVQNIWISCVNSNIGGYWSTPKGIDKLSTFLKLKKNEKCLGLFYLGIYDCPQTRNIPRKNIIDETEWFN